MQLAKQLLRKGNTVVATARSPRKATELQRLEAESSNKLTVTELDVAAAQSIEVRVLFRYNTDRHTKSV